MSTQTFILDVIHRD